jgi:UDP-N-acetylmuramoylalanine--D-glutamate ligase
MWTPESLSGRIAILGTGREGQSAWRYLRARRPELELTLIDEAEPDPAFAALLTSSDRLLIGPLDDAGLESCDVLIRSPGISPYRDCLQAARAAGVRVTSPSSLWFAAHPEARTVCVTGTKGKSTTSALLAHMLRGCGREVRLAGNIGRPLLDCDDRGVDWWVIELSSYQLADLEARPSLGVILNLSPEHLDWHGSEAAYQRDKLRLAKLAGSGAVIANAAEPRLREAFAGDPGVTWFNDPAGIHLRADGLGDGHLRLPLEMPASLPGAHNRSNVAAALTVIRRIGADLDAALAALPTFRALPHRLQPLGERGGIRFVDDSISSTPVATAAALEALSGRAITLIVGGLDRGIDWKACIRTMQEYPPASIIGVPDNGARVVRAVSAAGIEPALGLHEAADLAAAVALGVELTPAGGILLLSPGAPSFPRFRDYRDRGRRFATLCGFDPEEEGLEGAAGDGV